MFKSKKILKNEDTNFIVSGQGVYLFNSKDECSFTILNKDLDGFEISFYSDSIDVKRTSTGQSLVDPNNKSGILNLNGAYYWFSLDSQNQTLMAGIGEARIENKKFVYQYTFTKEENELRKTNKKFLEGINKIIPNNTNPLRILRDPITQNVPMKVFNTQEITMDLVAKNEIMPVTNLSLMSQKLYNCISGDKFILDTDDFPDFSQAIENSIKTPGLWCHEKLKEKANEFSKDKPDPNETYLRITLGQNNGESPGIPYVMEIWPSNHYSPIHNHAGAEAIIRVLYGQINVSLFPFLCGSKDGINPFTQADFNKGDVTWISPTLNQTHQLRNLNPNQTCITIQCYMYGDDNLVHYDYFDYVDADGLIQQYEPDLDMDFVEFKNLMKKEWAEHLEKERTKQQTQPRTGFKSLFCCM